jgi:PKD repeat protein
LANLAANIQSGVQPLTVNFDGSPSHDDDAIDTIASYAFNFGEGDDVVVQSTPTISHDFPNAGPHDLKLVVTDSRGKVSDNTAHQLIEVLQPFGVASIVSRKMHGTAPFDIDLPLTGDAGIECRGTGNTGNAYQLVYTFNRDVAVAGSAIKTQGTATLGAPTLGPNLNQVTVPLANVTNAQHVIVKLNEVHDTLGRNLNGSTARMDVLVGDVNASRVVNTDDTNLCKAQALQPVTNANFRNDINASGAINTGDVNLIKQNALAQLPP